MQRITIDWNLVMLSVPDRLKMFSNTSEPEYRMTGIYTNRYRIMYAMENHSLVGRS